MFRQGFSDSKHHPKDTASPDVEQREAIGTSSVLNDEQVHNSRSLPSETRVQERLQQESRKSKQAARAKQASRSAHKAGAKKSRQKGASAEV